MFPAEPLVLSSGPRIVPGEPWRPQDRGRAPGVSRLGAQQGWVLVCVDPGCGAAREAEGEGRPLRHPVLGPELPAAGPGVQHGGDPRSSALGSFGEHGAQEAPCQFSTFTVGPALPEPRPSQSPLRGWEGEPLTGHSAEGLQLHWSPDRCKHCTRDRWTSAPRDTRGHAPASLWWQYGHQRIRVCVPVKDTSSCNVCTDSLTLGSRPAARVTRVSSLRRVTASLRPGHQTAPLSCSGGLFNSGVSNGKTQKFNKRSAPQTVKRTLIYG